MTKDQMLVDNQYLYDLRQKIRANQDAGRDPEAGITQQDLQRTIQILRGSRALMEARKVSKATRAEPMSDEELKSMFS